MYPFLSKGYADAIASHETSMLQYIADYDVELRILDEPLLTVGLGVAFDLHDERGLDETLNAVLADMRRDGTMESIIGGYLGIGTELILSSRMEKDCSLRAHEKVISICKLLGGTEYYNSVSGVPLYEPHRDLFEAAGLELSFPVMRQIEYPQFRNEFVPNLSIIDVMMFNSQERCQELLHEYDLLKKGDVQL